MALTKKHFDQFARIIKADVDQIETLPKEVQPTARRILAGTADRLAAMCATENPRFDQLRFLKACGF